MRLRNVRCFRAPVVTFAAKCMHFRVPLTTKVVSTGEKKSKRKGGDGAEEKGVEGEGERKREENDWK